MSSLRLGGIGLYPKIINELITEMPELTSEYQIVLSDVDNMTVKVEVKKSTTCRSRLEEAMRAKIKEFTMLNVKVKNC